jgi:hypothetical protein
MYAINSWSCNFTDHHEMFEYHQVFTFQKQIIKFSSSDAVKRRFKFIFYANYNSSSTLDDRQHLISN